MTSVDAADVDARMAGPRAQKGLIVLVLVLAGAAIRVASSMATHRPVEWYTFGLIVALFCMTINVVTNDAKVQRVAIGAGMAFALAAIYGMLRR